ncbi:hypothetical protein QR685DRAFT_552427 [Neurospora intermedia]|uniref:Uncharacterized protein n=1 Tax=Neurospora intermedia TaxID=5142 RepID=A0ABR3DJ55_NEUIN
MRLRSGTVASATKEDLSSPEPSELILRRSARIQRSQSARPSQTPKPSRKPKTSASNPTPQISRGRPPTRSSGPRPQQASTFESQRSPTYTPTRRASTGSAAKELAESSANSPGVPSQLVSADPVIHSGTALATSSEQSFQDLESLHSGSPISGISQTLSVFQHSSGPYMEENDQQLSVPSSVSMSISSGSEPPPRADVS